MNASDIDLLWDAIYGPDPDPRFDLNGDNAVDQDDITYLIYAIMGSHYGDANGDGITNEDDVNCYWAGYQECNS